MTLAEKILAAHCGRNQVSPGELINVRADMVLANDVTAPLAIKEFRRLGVSRVFDPQRVVLVPDHFVPNKDIPSAENAKILREFSREQGLVFFEVGEMGIEHVLLPEKGLVVPGDVVVGADSHTCTYGGLGAFATGMGSTDVACAMATGDIWMRVPPTIRFLYHGQRQKWVGGKDLILHTIGQIGVDGAIYSALEFDGEAITALPMDARFTMANMAVEAGAKAGLFPVDEKTLAFVKDRARRPYQAYETDPDAQYQEVRQFDVSTIEPQVAFPHSPANVKPISQVGRIDIDQAVIGSCTNGRIDDLRIAAQVIKGKRVAPWVRCIVLPGSPEVCLQAIQEGLMETFIRSGVAVSTPTCGPCLGGYMGILADGERCVATTNRNFVGRMGSPGSEVYLSNPAVAAASAILGRIAGPEEVM
ncbi:MAG: 3-isopropylmalate dehydratase large subunit [Chloroflexi bacterium]|nr:3-isopropylmalate dehydratase large subunit [Chloroflexota bacterium]